MSVRQKVPENLAAPLRASRMGAEYMFLLLQVGLCGKDRVSKGPLLTMPRLHALPGQAKLWSTLIVGGKKE